MLILGHDVCRVTDLLPAMASDEAILECAVQEKRIILTQDLDGTSIIALSGRKTPSLASLRLASARVESVNDALQRIRPILQHELDLGALITVEDHRIRLRCLPVDAQDAPLR